MLPSTQADSLVLGYLGRGLSLEFTAVQQFSTQARLLVAWGLDNEAERLKTLAGEKIRVSEKIIARMLAVNVAPGASQLRPVQVGETLLSMLEEDCRLDAETQGLYGAAIAHCSRMEDSTNRLFFSGLLNSGQAVTCELSQWVAELGRPEKGSKS